MGFFKRKKEEKREENLSVSSLSAPLLQALLGNNEINRKSVMNLPTVSSCVNLIADVVSMVQVKLYRQDGDKITEIRDDNRLFLLNHETGDTLDATQFKKAMVMDMFLDKGGYAYVNRSIGGVKSLHYVEASQVGILKNADPIFKDCKINVTGRLFEHFDFIKLLRNSKDGIQGESIIEESKLMLSIILSTQKFEDKMVKRGGNKKGFLQSERHLDEKSISYLKTAFKRMYGNNSENVVILNDGMKFQESSNTSVEMQLNENKKTNSNAICNIFLVPPSIINGGATEDDKKLFKETCILPILDRFDTAINSVLLKEEEKGKYFFAFDTNDLMKGDIEKRFQAYQVALSSGFMQIDEVREKEKMPAYGLDFIKLGLQDVLYYPTNNQIYTPNTNKLSVMGEDIQINDNQTMEGGENDDEDRNS